jgi:hypothetical protein
LSSFHFCSLLFCSIALHSFSFVLLSPCLSSLCALLSGQLNFLNGSQVNTNCVSVSVCKDLAIFFLLLGKITKFAPPLPPPPPHTRLSCGQKPSGPETVH